MILWLDAARRFRIDFNKWAPTLNFQRTKKFPPGPGLWFRAPDGGIILGCLKCKGQYSVNPACHTILPDGRLQPSWTCVLCGSHTVVVLAGYAGVE